ncbi:CS-domain-containing protein [Coprinellus micaceus]|uniref:CS-domain-containing protein n=1 Tax=Coprinellus micaceus TaxID=71717 RepID=A0A4Y7TPP9_COPMI|nr:CS-domain-containing protein [Coprinellus micaceus]
MPRCTRKGCGKEFEAEKAEACTFHPGAPVFHEGLKSWSCCQEFNKPVLDFDEFMNLPGCTETDTHSVAAPETPSSTPAAAPATNPNVTSTRDGDGKETFSVGASRHTQTKSLSAAANASTPAAPAPTVEDEDDLSVTVAPGTMCKRKACGVVFVGDEVNRIGDGEGTVCVYHPMPPYFHEGSKGYLCCKPKVLEFDEFLKIKGCKTGRHCFVAKRQDTTEDELVQCRIDHYQTLEKVQVSVFAKKVNKEKSTVQFKNEEVKLNLSLPDNKRFVRTIKLFGPIDPARSSHTILGTKVELSLQKDDNRSWTVLEKTDRDLGNISLTFGVSGRTGTIGGKEIIIDPSSQPRVA